MASAKETIDAIRQAETEASVTEENAAREATEIIRRAQESAGQYRQEQLAAQKKASEALLQKAKEEAEHLKTQQLQAAKEEREKLREDAAERLPQAVQQILDWMADPGKEAG